jgi:DNA polymerase-3 subunit alpha
MAVFTLEDAGGGVEVIAFPETYQRSASLIDTGTMVLVRGKLERDDESVRILASEILPIEAVGERLARAVAIRVKMPAGRGVFEALGEIFSRHRGDRRVSFEIELAGGAPALRVKADVSSRIRVRPSPALIAKWKGRRARHGLAQMTFSVLRSPFSVVCSPFSVRVWH